ncbi:MAG: signal peptidase I [Planctomycetota bacterium]|nr:MAG: signal peptidase I [Planctomycetota bacterium]
MQPRLAPPDLQPPGPAPLPGRNAEGETSALWRLRTVSAVWELCKTLAIVVVLVFGLRTFVVEAYVIHGTSMEPTFHPNERLLVSKFAPRFEAIQRGDIIVFRHPTEPGKRLIKRVLGLPGETVEIEDGQVYIDGRLVEEPYLGLPGGGDFGPHRVPPNCYFVLGDNRKISNDSRVIGDVPADLVLGKAFLLFYPHLRSF